MGPSRLYLVTDASPVDPTQATQSPSPDSTEQIRTELRRILSSTQFDASDRNRRFLKYVVEETLRGRADRIKAYCIATIVFGRDDSFDPTLDPVVRMEARRLRRSLERFYLVEGEGGPIRIALPKGGYVPKFQSPAVLMLAADSVAGGNAEQEAADCGLSILVSPFEPDAADRCATINGTGFARQIVVGLSQNPEISVFMPVPACRPHHESAPNGLAPPVDFVLGGNLIEDLGVLKVSATLLAARTGKVIWAETLVSDVANEGISEARDRIADRIVGILSERMTMTGTPAFRRAALA